MKSAILGTQLCHMTVQLTEHLTVWELWYFKAVTSYRGKRFHVPTRLTTVTRQTSEYKVDLTRHLKFPLAFCELASGRFPHWKVNTSLNLIHSYNDFLISFKIRILNKCIVWYWWLIKIVCHALPVSCNIQDVTNIQEELLLWIKPTILRCHSMKITTWPYCYIIRIRIR
jgi:hypothetical protein